MSALLLLLLACETASPPEAPTAVEAPPGVVKAEAPAAPTIEAPTPSPPQRAERHPAPLPSSPAVESARGLLSGVVDRWAVDPENPWALAHGLAARGVELKLADGRGAVDHLFERYAEPFEVEGRTLLRFPESLGEVRVEPHSDLLLKSLVESGASPDRSVTVKGQPHRLADLWAGSLARTWLVPARNHSRYSSPDDIAWSLYGLSGWASPGLSWTAMDGTPMRMDELADFAATVLHKETRFLASARDSGQAFQRKGQGIFRYTCGGAHLLAGVSQALARGFGSPATRAAFQDQLGLLVYRFPIESGITRQAVEAYPEHADKLWVQRLKFAGHFLEGSSQLLIQGFGAPSPELAAVQQQAVDEVVAAITALEERGLLDQLPQVRARDEQLYLDIVGDSAHALHGLNLVLGQDEVRW